MCGLNLLGQALEYAREIFREETITPLCNSILLKTRFPWITYAPLSCDVDPVAHIRLDTFPNAAHAQTATLSPFTDLVPDDYITEVRLAHSKRVDAPLLPEQGPDLVSGAVAMNEATITSFLSLARGTSAMSRFNCRALLDTGSSQSFIRHRCTWSPIKPCNKMSSPAWPKQLDVLLIAPHSLSRGSSFDLLDPPPLRASKWSILSALTKVVSG